MSFTRFNDDPSRIKKQLQEMTGPGRYILNKPGNGSHPSYMEDPFIRLQQWGGNLRTNVVNLESDLKGLTRNLNRDSLIKNNYIDNDVKSKKINYPKTECFVDQTRASNPAWTLKDLEINNWDYLSSNPQDTCLINFDHNLSSRINIKDDYKNKS
tara:strand:- start:289 stop:753 length:465 start_codon:yes stop_codon:yes gene_type:complete